MINIHSNLAPIAIFAYDRVEHFKKMFKSLQECKLFHESDVTIFLDGPKSNTDRLRVDEMQLFAKKINLSNINLEIRNKNIGLKQSIHEGVSLLCNKHGKVIVLEDDLILSPCILEYFNTALENYKNDSRAWSIAGYQYNVPFLHNINRALVLPFAHCWGWATWKRAWEKFDIAEEIDEKNLKSSTFRHLFDANGLRDFTDMLELAVEGKINSWFIRWYYKIFTEGGVCIFPPKSYVKNIGIGAGGTHGTALSPYRFLTKSFLPSENLITMPENLSVDYWAVDKIASSWDAKLQKYISKLGNIKRNIF